MAKKQYIRMRIDQIIGDLVWAHCMTPEYERSLRCYWTPILNEEAPGWLEEVDSRIAELEAEAQKVS